MTGADSGSILGGDPEPTVVRSFDGSEIAVRSSGTGTATPLLVVPSVGATLAIWRKVLAQLGRQRRWINWDLRGLNASPPPRSERLDPAAHAADAIAVLDHMGIDRFAIVSWSNGSRIALEIARNMPAASTLLRSSTEATGSRSTVW